MVVPELLNIQIEWLKNDVISRLKQAAADKGGNAVLGFSLTVSTAVGSGGGNLVAVAQEPQSHSSLLQWRRQLP